MLGRAQLVLGYLAQSMLADGTSGGAWVAWVSSWILNPAFGALYLLLLQLFPDGRPATPRFRPLLHWSIGTIVVGSIIQPISGDTLDAPTRASTNPVGFLPEWTTAPVIVGLRDRPGALDRVDRRAVPACVRARSACSSSWYVLSAILTALLLPRARSRSTRSRRTSATGSSRSAERERSRCPLVAGIAMVRHRLYDVDFVLNRTLVYGALSACIVGAYAALVFGVGAIGSSQGRLVSAAAAAVCALAAAPLRNRLQRGVNRFLYGARDEPASAVAELGHRLEATLGPDAVLPDARRCRVARAAAPLRGRRACDADRVRARSARRNATRDAARDPARGPGRDGRPPRAVATQGRGGALAGRPRACSSCSRARPAPAVQAVRLHADLQRSREQLDHRARGGAPPAATRPARRARPVARGDRDAAARSPTRSSGEELRELHETLEAQASQALADIRRLVYELRPPALDELGLVSALREQGRRFGSLSVTIDADERFDDLPAALEVAIYRIASEAITNAARHGEREELRGQARRSTTRSTSTCATTARACHERCARASA